MRVWLDLTNRAHAIVLRPLAEEIERRGHEVVITARPLSHTVDLLESWGRPFTVLGHHGGASRPAKARAAAGRVGALLRFAHGRGLQTGLAHGSTDLPVACRLLGLPNATMFDYEWAVAQHNVNCRLATRVLVPDAIPAARLARYGARPPKLVRYRGLKEEYYLSDFEPDPTVLDELGVERDAVLCVVRTPPDYALYLRGAGGALLERLLRRVTAAPGVRTVVLARTPEQREAIRGLGLEELVIPDRTVDGRSLAGLADVLVSGGGTMNREAAVLGTPVWSLFEGRPGAVDEQLVREGRLRDLEDPEQVALVKKPPGALRDRVRRDPADLLSLAIPQLA